jgi:hypothetical protein
MESQDKIVSLFAFRAKQETQKKASEAAPEATIGQRLEDFETVMMRNRSNSDRLREERLKANKSVLKSYRIKH